MWDKYELPTQYDWWLTIMQQYVVYIELWMLYIMFSIFIFGNVLWKYIILLYCYTCDDAHISVGKLKIRILPPFQKVLYCMLMLNEWLAFQHNSYLVNWAIGSGFSLHWDIFIALMDFHFYIFSSICTEALVLISLTTQNPQQ